VKGRGRKTGGPATVEGARRSAARREWEEQVLQPALRERPELRPSFTTVSDVPIERLYTPEDLADWDAGARLGFPGEPPFTRGIHPTMYRGRPWTMRQFAGFGSAADTNGRFHYLLRQGQTGLSVAFDLPTLMGRDSDDPLAEGEVGREGVAIDTLADMEILFREIPLGRVSTSMTINAPAAVLLAMYLAVAERQGVAWTSLRGTIQNDILKEYIAQKEWIFPPGPSMRLIVDMMVFCTEAVPQWNTISISGYHIREAGSTAVQELAFTLADAIAYLQAGVDRGLHVDAFAPRLSFFFNAHNDLFEEVAKLRAARRMWQRITRERFGARDPRSWMLRTHVQTAGCSLTAQQPLNNVVRVTVQALAAVLGGTQSLHTNALDETLALPTEDSARLALRTQQILAAESGVANTIDPLAGSYFVETLTNRTEEAAAEYIRRIDAMGGMIASIEQGFPQREIAEASYHYQRQVDRGERTIVGLNQFVDEDRVRVPVLKIDPGVELLQLQRLEETRQSRDAARHAGALRILQDTAQGSGNLMPPLLEAVKAQASVGEICATLRCVFGSYREGTVPL
jgi:methylmalonyl-CoA mutase, N-terminal domain